MNRTVVLTAAGLLGAIVLALFVTSVDTGTPPKTRAREAPEDAPEAARPSPAPQTRPTPAPSRAAPPPAPGATDAQGSAQVDPFGDEHGGGAPPEEASRHDPPTHEVSVWPLDKEGIQGAVGEALPGVRACYEDALARDPDLAGRMALGFTVVDEDGIGKVTVVELDNGEVTDDGMIDCVLDTFEDLQFDPPEGGGELSVTYPVMFRPGDDCSEPTDTEPTWDDVPVVRLVATVLLVAWMVVGPVLGQGFNVNRPWLTAWHMYRTWGTGVLEVRMVQRTPEGDVPVDRLALLGHEGWVAAGPDRLVARKDKLDRQIAEVCQALGAQSDLRVFVREGGLHGWKPTRTGKKNACR